MAAAGGLSEAQVAQVKALVAAAAHPPGWTDGLNAVSDFVAKAAWPIIAGLLLWRLYPALKAIVTSRAFTIKVGSMEVSVPEQTASLTDQVKDLREQVLALKGATPPAAAAPAEPAAGAAPATATAATTGTPPQGRVLWVDDNMANNASEIAQLTETGVKVIEASSSPDAMVILRAGPAFDAVISDMGRREGGRYRAKAGLDLLQQMREANVATPYMIYTTRKLADENGALARAAGGDGATGSATDLIAWVRRKVPGGG